MMFNCFSTCPDFVGFGLTFVVFFISVIELLYLCSWSLAEVQYHEHACTIALADQMSRGGNYFPCFFQYRKGEAYILSPGIETDFIDFHRPFPGFLRR